MATCSLDQAQEITLCVRLAKMIKVGPVQRLPDTSSLETATTVMTSLSFTA